MCVYIYIYIDMCVYIYIYIYMYECMYVYIYIYIYICIYLCICVYIYIYIYTHMYPGHITIYQGKMVTLVGPHTGGKTTLLKMIGGGETTHPSPTASLSAQMYTRLVSKSAPTWSSRYRFTACHF